MPPPPIPPSLPPKKITMNLERKKIPGVILMVLSKVENSPIASR